jgi:hypothetical protein
MINLQKSPQVRYNLLKYLNIVLSNSTIPVGIYSSYFFGFDRWVFGIFFILLLFTVGTVDSLIAWKCTEYLTGDERKASRKKIRRRKPEFARKYDFLKYLSVFMVNSMIPGDAYVGIQFGLGNMQVGNLLVGVFTAVGIAESFVSWYLLEYLTEKEMRRGKNKAK